VRYANRAYVRAKGSQSGGWSVHAGAEGDPRERLALLGELHQAIDGGQLSLVFQPIFRLADGVPHAVEALVRWNHPVRGEITPSEFLPLAEETGLITTIGRWVITELCRQAVEWRHAGVVPRLNFNASPRELRDPRFATDLLEAIDRHGLPTKQFTLEITEATAMNQDERTARAVAGIRDAGVRIAIDDFGTGHSSLARLRNLPVDELKIDMAFLRGVPADRDATAVMTAILDLASALGLRAVAEGVENERQLDYLVRHGCPLGQGYYLTRPRPASSLPLR
jgi:EAL domain-containing protein (putative c-di-GMP-specific phosphodiesterase class I)